MTNRTAAQTRDVRTPGNVAGQATQTSALDRKSLNLLGLFGPKDDLQALVRLPNGRLKTVKTGSRISRSTVLGIDAEGMILEKSGKSQRIAIPGS
ncbi:hypothetical protein PH5382_00237 [Phaeobacter sp. CECT 5382]|uniref:hypothetical protein n=1 Tax=Rhodobacterales TaxID=204455 RepID=UPI0006DAC3D5|nr:hypothetical protein [Phaeobacter sp. CECT 5382]CUH86328.1 hypothetical protein PH5382_00237 [Phaeobacter sp. CECT 5382]